MQLQSTSVHWLVIARHDKGCAITSENCTRITCIALTNRDEAPSVKRPSILHRRLVVKGSCVVVTTKSTFLSVIVAVIAVHPEVSSPYSGSKISKREKSERDQFSKGSHEHEHERKRSPALQFILSCSKRKTKKSTVAKGSVHLQEAMPDRCRIFATSKGLVGHDPLMQAVSTVLCHVWT